MQEFEHLTVERVDGVGRIVMERADRHNAMNARMAGELRDATADLVEDDGVRAAVLTGTGAAFNTGADLTAFSGDATDGRDLRTVASRLHAAVRNLATAPMPTVTGVNGVAAGGGFGLALSADLVVVDEDARFEFAYPKLGLSGDGGSTFFLPRLVGHRRAREIALLDEPIPAEEAVEMGLATEVVGSDAFDDRLAELAATLSEGPTRAHAATKRLLNRSYSRTLPAQLAAETDSVSRLAGTEDYARGHAAFRGDDEPAFEGR
ncbi:enoyl-CoA hydratase/isomerase family protein [Halostella litorea]|uniref:enoyl-CoA hydratase/isomerase family protein n=1 Tax=Halostella litorea TaxID=2528831 RepID=UPI001092CBA5|nr:enoyl-CoA hydratase-related protein [Halostella litorea]